jgi:hypothetical protein
VEVIAMKEDRDKALQVQTCIAEKSNGDFGGRERLRRFICVDAIAPCFWCSIIQPQNDRVNFIRITMTSPFPLWFSPLLILTMFVITPFPATSQTQERIFCGICGNQNALLSTFCFHCGARLDKRALINRLRQRVGEADSLKRSLTLTAEEIQVFVQGELDRTTGFKTHRLEIRSTRPKTDVEKLLDVLAPAAIGLGALYLISVTTGILLR